MVKKIWIIAALVLVLVLSYFYFFGTHGIATLRQMQARADSLASMHDSMAKEYQDMIQRIEELEKGNPEMIEDEARNLNLVHPGEEMIIINIDSTYLDE